MLWVKFATHPGTWDGIALNRHQSCYLSQWWHGSLVHNMHGWKISVSWRFQSWLLKFSLPFLVKIHFQSQFIFKKKKKKKESHLWLWKKRVQGYSAKTKPYMRCENKAMKNKVLLFYKILWYIYEQNQQQWKKFSFVKLTDQPLFKTRFPKKWTNIQEGNR